jgi:hypothetical protein
MTALFIAEIALRVLAKFNPPGRFIYAPNHTYYFHPDSSILVGIHGEKKFKTNAQGFRGDEDFTDTTYNVLCVGGSTTECNYLDNNETWYSLLNQSPAIARLMGAGKKQVVIASVGLSGQTSFENYFMLNELLLKHKNIHQVILMCGINDFVKVLAKPSLNISVVNKRIHWLKRIVSPAIGIYRAELTIPHGPDIRLCFMLYERSFLLRLRKILSIEKEK